MANSLVVSKETIVGWAGDRQMASFRFLDPVRSFIKQAKATTGCGKCRKAPKPVELPDSIYRAVLRGSVFATEKSLLADRLEVLLILPGQQ